MTHTRSTLIRERGVTRVLRLVCADGHTWPLRYRVRHSTPMCERCGCTERFGCFGGCGWVTKERDLCSRCYQKGLLK